MPDVLIITDPFVSTSQPTATPAIAAEMRRAILESIRPTFKGESARKQPFQIEILPTSSLQDLKDTDWVAQAELQVCPLTLELPEWVPFFAGKVFAACKCVEKLQQRVSDWGYAVGAGSCWLPIVLTAKGPLYAEVITQVNQSEQRYQQPFHLKDSERQPLYELGNRLLKSLDASPGVYLMQFSLEVPIRFERLVPFPAQPAIASVGVQVPDLFTCHWRCLTQQPIREITILSSR
ncbi:hypothetical protein OsccyDRAFT_3125 [Leptolyngbyaceae cyanobacterium JSC-12]|nr:hypothetical protein OsccyDRAFT_3125 [Leptolyngbyaceae cyanobacterium JSC-12]